MKANGLFHLWVGLALAAWLFLSATVSAQPSDRELIEAVQRQVKEVMAKTEGAIACVVVSRSPHYPDPPPAPTDPPGRLGSFDRLRFLESSPLPNKVPLSHRLDLEDRSSIADNSYGGGVVIDSSGLVLTLYHVIEGARKIYVRLPGIQGSYADILAADARCDLAVLKLQRPPGNLKAVPVAAVRPAPAPAGHTANLDRGHLAVLMANLPDSKLADLPTGAMAVIGGVRERLSARSADETQSRLWTIYHYGSLIQYANQFPAGRLSRLNLPCSGGALFNLDGELIALTTTISPLSAGDDVWGYALPMDEHARRALDVLKRGEEIEYGFLGVTSSEDRLGLSIRVSPNGPADQAKLMDGDIIRQVNGVPIASHKDLFLQVGSALANNLVTIRVQRTVFRDGRRVTGEMDLVARLGKYHHGLPFIASAQPAAVFGLRVDHGSVLVQQLLAPEVALRLPPGVVIRELMPGSPAETKLKPLLEGPGRWLITAVNGQAVASPKEFYAAAKDQPRVRLTLVDPFSSPAQTREITLP